MARRKKQAGSPLHRLAKGWALVGFLGLAFDAVMAISVFKFGAPVHDRHSGRILSRAELEEIVETMAMGFGFFAAIGLFFLFLLKAGADPE
jgi:hypothetical protein